MKVVEVCSKDFLDVVNDPYHIYASSGFNDLNSVKCEEVYYLLFKERKYRLAIAGGKVMNEFRSPFSAPFGGFVFFSDSVGQEHIDRAIEALVAWVRSKGMLKIRITLPPAIYHDSFISKLVNSFYRSRFSAEKIDLNHAFLLNAFDVSYQEKICHNARRNLKKSFSNDLTFKKVRKMEEKSIVYDVIKKNREDKGYSLRMSFENIIDTTDVVKADFFLVRNNTGKPVASSLVFHVASDIVQVIYWGGLLEYNDLKTMNFMSYRIFDYYNKLKKKIVDIGPSTSDSVPNNGLCVFKESIGCNVSLKFSFFRDLL